MLGIHNIFDTLAAGGKMYSQIEFVVEITDKQADDLFGLALKHGLEISSGSIDELEIVTFMSFDAEAKMSLSKLVKLVEEVGATFIRVNLDLVGIPEIADYAGVNPETVRLWSTGKRKANFPKHYIGIGASSYWLWSEVAEWLRENGYKIDPTYDYVPLCGELKLVAA
jgi:hypothetical protein